MSGVRFSVSSGEITTSTALKTMLQIVAAANHRVLITEWGISFQGVSNTAAPILFGFAIQTDAGTSSAATPIKLVPGDTETLQVTARTNASAEEPTTTTAILAPEMLIHPQTGYVWQARYGEPLVIEGGTRLAFRVTAAAAVDCTVYAVGEE